MIPAKVEGAPSVGKKGDGGRFRDKDEGGGGSCSVGGELFREV